MSAAFAQDGGDGPVALIRDTEIEEILHQDADPIFTAAGINPKVVHIYIVGDKDINAFVAGGQNLFINMGLIVRTRNPNELIGVMAHETGHMAGGHLARSDEGEKQALATYLLTMGLGMLAAVAGAPDAAAGLIYSAGEFAYLTSAGFTRIQEASADQAAITYLERSGQSARGIVDFFDNFRYEEVFDNARRYKFFNDHPLTGDRIDALRVRAEQQPHYNTVDSPEALAKHAIMVAKLKAFMDLPQQTFLDYPESDTSFPAQYARAIAYYRDLQTDKALKAIDALIVERPDDPYLYELKGQALFESGRAAEAEPAHRKSVELNPDAPMLRMNYGQALLGEDNPGQARRRDRRDPPLAGHGERQPLRLAPALASLRSEKPAGHGEACCGGRKLRPWPVSRSPHLRHARPSAADQEQSGMAPRNRYRAGLQPYARRSASARPGRQRVGDDQTLTLRLLPTCCTRRPPRWRPINAPALSLSLILFAWPALALAACKKLGEDRGFDDKVHAYLLNHPEVLTEIQAKLQEKEQQQAMARAKVLIAQNRAAIERDPSDYVANPNGKITVTEFYDYRCPFCAEITPNLLALIHDNPDVRFVFKDFVIHGDVAAEAASGAMMVKKNGGDFLGLYRDLMAAKGLDQAGVEQILKAHGVDPASLAEPPFAQASRQPLRRHSATGAGRGRQRHAGLHRRRHGMIPGGRHEGLKAAVAAARAGKAA